MIERRNFYRILHVQPDAPMTVIKESYRVLLQKLKINPDLAGPDLNESLLAIAYNTLRDPLKRAAYDLDLLKRHHIKTLSQGAFGSNTSFEAEVDKQKNERTVQLNQRNYYRILQIQSDAPIATITASYQALRKNSSQETALLDEAYRILSNPDARKQYDAIFAGSLFHAAGKSAHQNTDLPGLPVQVKSTPQFAIESYRAVITHYCSFCKTPYVPQANIYQSESCLECVSPLLVLQHENFETSRRTMMRINIRGEFVFYLFWPGRPCQGTFQDLSPTGIRFLTEVMLDPNDIIKIDAPNFQAVAEVTHKRNEGERISVGTRFIAVKFDQQHGNFVKVQV